MSTLLEKVLEQVDALPQDEQDAIASGRREGFIARLRTHEQELKEAGILRLSLFGSFARGDAGPDSDIDIAVCLGDGFSTGGLDHFWQLDRLQERLSQLLGCKVDVVAEPVRKERFQNEIDRDRVLAF